jgi:hypothetical protein
MLHSWESFSNQPEGSFLPPANTSMSKSSKSPVSSLRQDQSPGGASPGASALGAELFRDRPLCWFFRADDRDLSLYCAHYFLLAEFARFVVGFSAAILRSSALSDLVSLSTDSHLTAHAGNSGPPTLSA